MSMAPTAAMLMTTSASSSILVDLVERKGGKKGREREREREREGKTDKEEMVELLGNEPPASKESATKHREKKETHKVKA